jgi:hypothetical protein
MHLPICRILSGVYMNCQVRARLVLRRICFGVVGPTRAKGHLFRRYWYGNCDARGGTQSRLSSQGEATFFLNSTRCNRIAILIPIARWGGSIRTNCGSARMSNVRLRCKSKFATLWLMHQEPLDRSSDVNALIESLRVEIQQLRQRLAELEEKHQRELELCRVVTLCRNIAHSLRVP